MILKIEYVPDAETEVYFKAADVLALPYTHIFQSGVLSLGYGFGLPVIAADVGSLKEEIIEGKTGLCVPGEGFAGIGEGPSKRISPAICSRIWRTGGRKSGNMRMNAILGPQVAAITTKVYSNLLGN